jgi:exopolysaccharide production protein ExoZ
VQSVVNSVGACYELPFSVAAQMASDRVMLLRIAEIETLSRKKSTVYVGVQALRGIAAMLVVMNHVLDMLHDRLAAPAGNFGLEWLPAGVDIFFAISGFIMVMTTAPYWGRAGQWRSFLVRRCIRIAPLYWICTAAKTAVTLALPGLAVHPHVLLWYVTASFLLIPAWDADHISTHPILTVGWTLSFEMLFYAFFAVGLALSKRPVKWVIALLCLATFAGLFRTDNWGACASLLDPILLEFIFGMVIGLATLAGKRLPIPVAYAAIVVAGALLWISNGGFSNSYSRTLLWGIPGALLLAVALSVEHRWQNQLAGLPKLLGDASYAIYLTHGFALPAVGIVMAKLHSNHPMVLVAASILALIVSATVGIIAHLYLERPLLRFLTAPRTVVASAA